MLDEPQQNVNPLKKDCTDSAPEYHRQSNGEILYSEVSSSGSLGPACLLDENMSSSFASLFTDLGFRVEQVTHTLQEGVDDILILRHAQERNQLVISEDKKDFGRLIFSEDVVFSQGVVLVRKPDVDHVREVIRRRRDPLKGYFTTIDHKYSPRQRPLPG